MKKCPASHPYLHPKTDNSSCSTEVGRRGPAIRWFADMQSCRAAFMALRNSLPRQLSHAESEKKRGNASGPREKYRGISIPWPGLTAKAPHLSPPAKSTQLVSSGAVSALICFAFWTTLGTLLRSPES